MSNRLSTDRLFLPHPMAGPVHQMRTLNNWLVTVYLIAALGLAVFSGLQVVG